ESTTRYTQRLPTRIGHWGLLIFALKSPGFRCTGSSPCGSPELRCEGVPVATAEKAKAEATARHSARTAARQSFSAFLLVLFAVVSRLLRFPRPFDRRRDPDRSFRGLRTPRYRRIMRNRY